MLNQTHILTDILNPDEEGELYEHDCSVGEFLMGHFAQWPANARLYHNSISLANDITPDSPDGVKRLEELQGKFYIVIYPSDPLVVVAIISVIAIVAAFALMPKVPTVALRNTSAPSPNNELAARTNQARPNGRIPDIFGTVRSTPDLVSLPYSTFLNNREVENSLMCIGRGQYEILDARDAATPIAQIGGSSVEVYRPDTDISIGIPYYAIGDEITEAPINATKNTSVNGQTLIPTNLTSWQGEGQVYAIPDGRWTKSGGPAFDSVFAAGDTIVASNTQSYHPPLNDNAFYMAPYDAVSFVFPAASVPANWEKATLLTLSGSFEAYPSTGGTHDFSGTYNVVSVGMVYGIIPAGGTAEAAYDAVRVVLDNPGSVNASWNITGYTWTQNTAGMAVEFGTPIFDLDGSYVISAIDPNSITVAPTAAWAHVPSPYSALTSPSFYRPADNVVVGPFTLDDPKGTIVIANFIAPNGLYKDDGRNQYAETVQVELVVTPVDSTGVPIAADQVFTLNLVGSNKDRDQIAGTIYVNVSTGRCNVKARRVTFSDKAFKGTVVDEVKWRDLYHAHPVPNGNFGNVTMVRSRTYATTGALSLKERKLNFLVTRQVQLRVGATDTFTADLHSTNRADEIIAHVARDPKIGGRTIAEIDLENIYSIIAQVIAYFGTTQAAEFCYTFDKDDLTYEDTVMAIAGTVFCTAYRRGAELRLAFERSTEDSTLLFNHRNKIPGTERRTVRFGNEKNYDGVEFLWVNPVDDAIETLSLNDGFSNRPKRVESIGVRNSVQAKYHANRHWNKIRYQSQSIEFESLAQGELTLVGDRILVADNTSVEEQDGDIVAQDGFVVTTSQPVVMDIAKTYTVFLQMYDGTVQSMDALPIAGQTYKFQLTEAPLLPLVLDPDHFSRTKYLLVESGSLVRRAFIVTEREPGESNTSKIVAINYDPRYYQADLPPNPYGLGYRLGESLGGVDLGA